jgi:phosphopantothenoylcysteine decarboxylase/phosphopantothenate--cysteine ligase
MAAAVADWRPAEVHGQKMKKHAATQSLALVRTRDILMTEKPLKANRLYVGFAAETENVCEEALRKCTVKGLDLMVANDASQPDAAFEVDTNRVLLVAADGQVDALELLSKRDVASRIFDRIDALLSLR